MYPTQLTATTAALRATALTVILTSMSATAADQSMYRCQDGDRVTFSEEPCGQNAREVDVHYDMPTPAAAATAGAQLQTEEAEASEAAGQTEQQERIAAAEREIERLGAERDRRLAELAAERDRGSENRADDQYWEIMQGRIDAVQDQYDVRIRAVQAEIEELRPH